MRRRADTAASARLRAAGPANPTAAARTPADDPVTRDDAPHRRSGGPLLLGVRFDDEVVLLDTQHGRLVRLDAEAVRVWEACGDGHSLRHPGSAGAPPCVSGRGGVILRNLVRAGAVRRDGTGWVRTPVRWI